ncbi:MAG: ABC transporter ATP-binding protein [Sutterella wadsworthensis]|nr:ABC transporter ATP-binding protein [Sutterella wadsworthensis]MDU5054362.1 peptide ABC transporter ATP-binding protein [Sutterella wadsworthensis]
MGKIVLKVDDLKRFYTVSTGFMKPKATLKALNGISFELEEGKTLAIVGESGSGKSTMARQLTMIEEPTSGELEIDGERVEHLYPNRIRELRKKIQMVFQNPYGSLNPRRKIGDQLSEPLIINTDLSKEERRARVDEMMKIIGLRPEHYYRYPHMFSGGQRQRIAIARAMILNPKIVVADEPTSALDVSTQAQVLNLFLDLQEEFKTAYVFISHNLAVVEHVADHVLVMYLGKAVEIADKRTLYSQPLHPYTQALLSATPSVDPAKRTKKIPLEGELPSPINPPSGCTFHRRCPYARARCMKEEPQLREIAGRQVACHYAAEFAYPAAADREEEVVVVRAPERTILKATGKVPAKYTPPAEKAVEKGADVANELDDLA